MANSVFYKGVRKSLQYAATQLARLLPLWKQTDSITLLPPLLSIPVTRPVNAAHLPESFAAQFIGVKSIPARRLFVLKNVYISKEAVVFKHFRIFTPSLTWLRNLELYRRGAVLLRQWRKKISVTETAALVFDDWSATNYYHWMIESLPRLLLVQAPFLIVPCWFQSRPQPLSHKHSSYLAAAKPSRCTNMTALF